MCENSRNSIVSLENQMQHISKNVSNKEPSHIIRKDRTDSTIRKIFHRGKKHYYKIHSLRYGLGFKKF